MVRDLHDGAQQRLVHTIVTLKLAQQALHDDPGSADALLADALDTAERATAEVRELAHGILPSVLDPSGLRAGVDALASRLGLPVELDVSSERLPADIEASAYFIVAEALTNVVKHARATRATVRAAVEDGVLDLEVRDDGVGGADPDRTRPDGHRRPGRRARRPPADRQCARRRDRAGRPAALVDGAAARSAGGLIARRDQPWRRNLSREAEAPTC